MSFVGQRLAHYRVLAKLGAGGMGEVYRAHDEHLGRDVAIKVLPSGSFGDPEARARLIREARIGSQLTHPNICTVYEVGEAEGEAYIAMELVEGQTLTAKLASRPLPADQALRVGLQLADALAHAHDRGVVHRDFKSTNVIITPDGRAKILDFGLAKQLSSAEAQDPTTYLSLTAPGTLVGTVAYMAPEQLRGQPANACSDVWALGVVLYEMLAGTPPFVGRTQFELSSAILHEAPSRFRAEAPSVLTAVIERCLQKDVAARYRHGADVRAALETAQAGTAPAPVASRLGRRRVAVLPLQNVSGDPAQDYFVEGMHEALITDLAQIRSLRVIARSSVLRYKGVETPIPEIAEALNVDAVLTGSVTRLGDRVRITAQLIDAATEEHLWAARYERGVRDVLSLQNELVAAMAREIETQLTPQERERLARARPVHPDAYEAYLKGQAHFYRLTPHDLDAALQYFELALQKDPDYATAYAGISGVWAGRVVLGMAPPLELWPRAKAAAIRAIELDDTLAVAHYALAGVLWNGDWDWTGAESEYLRALDLNPNYPEGRLFYGHFLTAMRRWQEAEIQMEQAMTLDPFNPLFQGLYGLHLMWVHRVDEAIVQFRKALQTAPHFPFPRIGLTCVFWKRGLYEEALPELRAAFGEGYGDSQVASALTTGHAESGFTDAASNAAEVLAARSRTAYVKPFLVAWLYDLGGRQDDALEWLQRSLELRDHDMVYLSVHPLSDALRSDPRFHSLLRQMNLPAS